MNKNLEKVLDFVERHNKQDKEPDVAQAAEELRCTCNDKVGYICDAHEEWPDTEKLPLESRERSGCCAAVIASYHTEGVGTTLTCANCDSILSGVLDENRCLTPTGNKYNRSKWENPKFLKTNDAPFAKPMTPNNQPDTEELCFNHQRPIPCDSCTGSTVKETKYRPEYLAEIRKAYRPLPNGLTMPSHEDVNFLLHTIDEKNKQLERFERALRGIDEYSYLGKEDNGAVFVSKMDVDRIKELARNALYD